MINWDREDREQALVRERGFWHLSDRWPFDTPSHVFVARFIIQMGTTQFVDWPQSPADVWESARTNLYTVTGALRESLAWGRLRAALQLSDGSTRDTPPNVWNRRESLSWLRWGQAPLSAADDGYGRRHPLAGGPENCWLFIERADLNDAVPPGSSVRLLAKVGEAPTLPAPPTFLSPYLQLMLKLSRDMGMTEAEQPKKAEIVARLTAETASWAERPSTTLIEHMATLMRSPDRQKGRGRR